MNNLEKLKQIMMNNWKLKLLAVVLAVLVVYEIREATSFEIPYDLPIKAEVGEGIAILDQPKTIRVLFRGSQEDLRRLSQNEITIVIKPKATDPAGSEKITIKSGDIRGAPGIRVMKIEPRVVTISFDREIEKDLAITKPQIIGTPLIGKVELDYQPRTVKIRGSNLRLRNKEEIGTEPVDVDGRVESFSKTLRVLPPRDTQVSLIEPAEITVNVNIVTESITREWKNVKVCGIVPPGFNSEICFSPASVNVALKGSLEEIDNIASNPVVAFVDCNGMVAGVVTTLPVQVHIPAGTDIKAVVEPQTVRAEVSSR